MRTVLLKYRTVLRWRDPPRTLFVFLIISPIFARDIFGQKNIPLKKACFNTHWRGWDWAISAAIKSRLHIRLRGLNLHDCRAHTVFSNLHYFKPRVLMCSPSSDPHETLRPQLSKTAQNKLHQPSVEETPHFEAPSAELKYQG